MSTQPLSMVSSFKRLPNHAPTTYVQGFFEVGETVEVLEEILGAHILIARDVDNEIIVTSRLGCQRNFIHTRHVRENLMNKLWRIGTGQPPALDWYWQAAINSGVVGMLEHWPLSMGHIAVHGYIIPSPTVYKMFYTKELQPKVIIGRVDIKDKPQGWHSYFPNWVSSFYTGPFQRSLIQLAEGDEDVSGEKLHQRYGIVIHSLDRPTLYARVLNPKVGEMLLKPTPSEA